MGNQKNWAGGMAAVKTALKMTKDIAGTRGLRSLLHVNQKSGFDCPGCAWPEGETRSIAEFCENGAKAVADAATTRMVDPSFLEGTHLGRMYFQSETWVSGQGRLAFPMAYRRGQDNYRQSNWPGILDDIAGHLNALPDPSQAIFYTSGRTSNEAAFFMGLN